MKVLLAALLAALAVAATAQAGNPQPQGNLAGRAIATAALSKHVQTRLSPKSFHTVYASSFLDGVESGIAGLSLTTVLEDDPGEWSSLFGVDSAVLGFTCITSLDPSDWCYRRVFLGPQASITFINWFNNNQAPTYIDAAVAIMTVTHEANHWKLYSADEGRVNACALQQFPGVIDTYFGIHPTITKTVAVRKVVWRKKWVWVRRNGQRVRVRKRVRRVITVYVNRTVANPDYVYLNQAAAAFYRSQPPPYSTGTCW